MKYATTSIKRFFLSSMISLALISMGLWGTVWIYAEYRAFRVESEALREHSLGAQKDLLSSEVAKLADYVHYMVNQTETKLKSSIKSRVNEACQTATNLYLQNRDTKAPEEIKKMIKDALRPIRFNNDNGYLFAFNVSGVAELRPDRPEMEGRDMLSSANTPGELVVRDMIRLVQSRGEGFYEYKWTKPQEGETLYPKEAFVKVFEPYGWGIGAGEYLDSVRSQTQHEVLARLATMRFGSEGYFFGSKFDGSPLFSNGKITEGTENIWDLTDSNGVKIIQEQRKAVSKAGGGFVSYSWPTLESKEPTPKMSYVVGIPEWQWIIGAGAYLETIQSEIDRSAAGLKRNLMAKIKASVAVLLLAIVLAFLWGAYLSNALNPALQLSHHSLKMRPRNR